MRKRTLSYSMTWGLFTLLILTFACQSTPEEAASTSEANSMDSLKTATGLLSTDFDTILNGQTVGLHWIRYVSILAAFTNYGARIIVILVPDKEGNLTAVFVVKGSFYGYSESSETDVDATILRVYIR